MALADNSTPGEVVLNGDIHGSVDALVPELTPTGVAAGVYNFPNLVVDTKGRILTIEEFTVDDVPCATKVSCGIVKIEQYNLSVTNGIVDYSPDATYGNKGVVQAGSGFNVTAGLLYIELEPATTLVIGAVKVPTAGNLNIDVSGNISVPVPTDIQLGIIQIPGGDGLSVDVSGNLTFDETTLADATAVSKGIVQIGDNINVAVGVISVDVGTAAVKGVLQGSQTAQVQNGEMFLLDAGNSGPDIGVIRVGNGLDILSETIYVADATTISKGVVQIGDNIDVAAGVISVPNTTAVSKGVVEVGTNIDVASGVLSIADASGASTFGVVTEGSYVDITNGQINITSLIPELDVINTYTASQSDAITTLSGASPIDVGGNPAEYLNLITNYQIDLLADVVGAVWTLILKQDATGGRTVTWGAEFEFPAGSGDQPSPDPDTYTIIKMMQIGPSEVKCIILRDIF